MPDIVQFVKSLFRKRKAHQPWFKHYDKDVPRETTIPDVPMTYYLDDAVAKFPDGVFIHYMGRRITFAEFNILVNKCAFALSKLGVRQKDRVAIILPNIPQYAILHWAIMRLGAVIVPTNPLYSQRELAHQLKDSGAKTAVILDLIFHRLQEVAEQTELKNIIVTGVKDFLPPLMRLLYPLKEMSEGYWKKIPRQSSIYFFAELMRRASDVVPTQKIHADDTALLLYTGGTTGIAKGAILTHKNIVANALQARAWLTDVVDGKEVIMAALPLFHSYGMTACHHFAMLCKAAMVLVPKFEPLRVMKEINRLKVTIFPGVPTMYVAINNHPNVNKYNLESVRLCISGGAALPREVQQTFERITGARLVEGYGLSECSPVTHCNPMKGSGKTGSIGLPWPNTQAKIVDQKTGDALRAGAIGELAVRGPQVMKCYWKNDKETEGAFKKEWLLTGDMGKMDEDGYFFVIDRKKDMIVSGGFNIYPREIEDVLCEHPKVSEVAVIGIPDDYFGESVKAFIVLQNGVDVTPDEIQKFCKGKLAKYKIPKEISFRKELPKSLIGKVLRRVLVEEVLA